MRLSQVKGDRCFEVIADVIEPLTAIAQDEHAKAVFAGDQKGLMTRIVKHAPHIIKGHKDDLVAVMAAIEGVTAEEYAEGLTMAKLLKDVYELLTDEELVAFLS